MTTPFAPPKRPERGYVGGSTSRGFHELRSGRTSSMAVHGGDVRVLLYLSRLVGEVALTP